MKLHINLRKNPGRALANSKQITSIEMYEEKCFETTKNASLCREHNYYQRNIMWDDDLSISSFRLLLAAGISYTHTLFCIIPEGKILVRIYLTNTRPDSIYTRIYLLISMCSYYRAVVTITRSALILCFPFSFVTS